MDQFVCDCPTCRHCFNIEGEYGHYCLDAGVCNKPEVKEMYKHLKRLEYSLCAAFRVATHVGDALRRISKDDLQTLFDKGSFLINDVEDMCGSINSMKKFTKRFI